jgi:hypothetical protein
MRRVAVPGVVVIASPAPPPPPRPPVEIPLTNLYGTIVAAEFSTPMDDGFDPGFQLNFGAKMIEPYESDVLGWFICRPFQLPDDGVGPHLADISYGGFRNEATQFYWINLARLLSNYPGQKVKVEFYGNWMGSRGDGVVDISASAIKSFSIVKESGDVLYVDGITVAAPSARIVVDSEVRTCEEVGDLMATVEYDGQIFSFTPA